MKKQQESNSRCNFIKIFKGFDERALRPFLIHKYSKVKKERDYILF